MNPQEHALTIFAEELGEVGAEFLAQGQALLALQKRVLKALRFGLDEQRDLALTNRQRIESEWQDLLASMANMDRHGLSIKPDLEAIAAKLGRIDDYTAYAKSLGTVVAEGPPVGLTDLQMPETPSADLLYNACLLMEHDFGLCDEAEQRRRVSSMSDSWRAIWEALHDAELATRQRPSNDSAGAPNR